MHRDGCGRAVRCVLTCLGIPGVNAQNRRAQPAFLPSRPGGNAKANERLSNRRAQAVINYLKQSGKVLPGRVLGASAMGEMHIPVVKPSASELQGARKVTVRVLTSAAHLPK